MVTLLLTHLPNNYTLKSMLKGHIHNHSLILDDPINLPEGTKVLVSISTIKEDVRTGDIFGSWKDDRQVEKIVEEIVGSRSVGRVFE